VLDRVVWSLGLAEAIDFAARRPSSLVVVRVQDPAEVLAVPPDRYQGHVLALVHAETSSPISALRNVLALAAGSENLSVGVTPAGSGWRESLDAYLELLRSVKALGEPAARIFVAPGGSDDGSCSREAPCASFDRAYKAGQAGDVVEVAGGTYPSQFIAADPAKTAPDRVVVRPAPGEDVRITGSLIVEASHIELRSIRAGFWKSRLATDQVFRDLDVALFFIHGSYEVAVSGGEWDRMRTPTVRSQVCPDAFQRTSASRRFCFTTRSRLTRRRIRNASRSERASESRSAPTDS
jgi:hypothetical protein